MPGGQHNLGWQLCFPLSLQAGRSDLRFYNGSDLKDLSIDERVGAWRRVFGQAHRDITVGFLLLRYSVVCTVESLSLFYLLFIS